MADPSSIVGLAFTVTVVFAEAVHPVVVFVRETT